MRISLRIWLIILVNGILYCSACFEEERIALLQIKSSLKAYPDPFPSWVDDKKSNCCQWEAVKCSNTTMHVIKLSVNAISSATNLYFNASMFLPFQNLRALYLPENYLQGCFKNEGFDKLSKLRNLEVLDLSFNNFDRAVLSSLSQLSSLKFLNLSNNPLDLSTNTPNLNDFTSLKYLDIFGNDLFTFGSSRYGLTMPAGLGNLEFLSLGRNSFNNSIFSSLKELPSLKSLDLSYNKLKGTIFAEELDALSNLEELDLSGNEINDFQTSSGRQ